MGLAASLPNEILQEIFLQVGWQSIGRCCLVCSQWNQAISDDFFWKKLFPKVIPPPGTSIRNFLRTHGIRSEEELCYRLKNFILKIGQGVAGRFVCQDISSLHPQAVVHVGLDVPIDASLQKEQIWILLSNRQGLEEEVGNPFFLSRKSEDLISYAIIQEKCLDSEDSCLIRMILNQRIKKKR